MRHAILLSILFLLTSISAYPQTFLWGRMASGGFESRGRAVAADSSGHVYVAGTFQNDGGTETDFSGVRPAAFGRTDLFLAKYDNNGRLIWVRSGGSPDFDNAHSICVDRSGDIYVTGVMGPGFYTFDTNRFEDVNRKRVYVAKYNPYGGLLWVMNDTTAEGFTPPLISCGPDKEIYLAAHQLGGLAIARYDTAGKEIWRRIARAAKDGFIQCFGIAAAPDGGVGITGVASLPVLFDTIELMNTFIVRYNAEGEVVWGRSDLSHLYISPSGIGIDAAGNSYITGTVQDSNYTTDTSFIVMYDPAGVQMWSTIIPGMMYDIAVTPAGTVYLTGTNPGTMGLVVAGYTSDGSGWMKIASGNMDYGLGIAHDRNNNIFVTGLFGANMSPSPALRLDDIELNGDASINMFVAKLGSTSDVEEQNIPTISANTRLHHVAPNPSTGAATVRIEIGTPSSARLALYNARGEEIAVVMEEKIMEGSHDIPIDLHALPNGIYILRLHTGSSSHAARILLVR